MILKSSLHTAYLCLHCAPNASNAYVISVSVTTRQRQSKPTITRHRLLCTQLSSQFPQSIALDPNILPTIHCARPCTYLQALASPQPTSLLPTNPCTTRQRPTINCARSPQPSPQTSAPQPASYLCHS